MRMGRIQQITLGAVVALAATTSTGRSHACGGCFHEPDVQQGSENKSTVIVAHRMALSISPAQTVLWDQVQYAGAPGSFAWVLPVKPGARLELSTDAWFETLDAATTVRVQSPAVQCGFSGGTDDDYGYGYDYGDDYGSSSGCSPACGAQYEGSGPYDYYGDGAGGGAGEVNEPPPPPPVVVVHQSTVGPYETVTLHANDPNALPGWLTDHGFVIDAGIQPIIDAYTSEGFDFIAMKLVPGQGVDRMKPVRVVTPGASPALPLRMVAAGTGANVGITLFVISEGRYQPTNFPNAQVDTSQLYWDFDTSDSNYATLRKDLLAQGGYRTWTTPYAKIGSLLSPSLMFGDTPASYFVGPTAYGTIAEAYVQQALMNQEGTDASCIPSLIAAGASTVRVVEACDPSGSGNQGSGGTNTGGANSGGANSGGANSGGANSGAANAGGEGPLPVPTCGTFEMDGRTLACGEIDDVAVALVGLHPKDVWLTRLESNLSRAALAEDLELGVSDISEVDNGLTATTYQGDPCAALGGVPLMNKRPIGTLPRGTGKATIAKGRTPSLAAALAVAAVSLTFARRFVRRRDKR